MTSKFSFIDTHLGSKDGEDGWWSLSSLWLTDIEESDGPKKSFRRWPGVDCIGEYEMLQVDKFRAAQTPGGGNPQEAAGIKSDALRCWISFFTLSASLNTDIFIVDITQHHPSFDKQYPRPPTATMRFLPLVSLASLTLAAPHLKRQTCSSSTLQWTITGFTTFTANPGPNAVSSISFDFVDETSGTSSECSRSLPTGTGGSPADPNNSYPCANAAFQYKWDGTTLSLEETLQCGTWVESYVV